MSELKPCPFCGGDPVVEPYYHGKEVEGYTVACLYRGCVNPQISLDGDRENAIKAWNTRPASPAAVKAVDELIKLSSDLTYLNVKMMEEEYYDTKASLADARSRVLAMIPCTPKVDREEILDKYIARMKRDRWEIEGGGYGGAGLRRILSDLMDEVTR